MSYLSAPLWFLFLALSTALLAVHTLTEPQYFVAPHQLFPVWPQWHPEEAIALFSTTAILLFFPKILSVLLVWAKGAKEYGGGVKLFWSMLWEVLFSMLLAPIRMVFHTRFVVAAFLGMSVQWNSPKRDNNQTSWGEASRRHGLQTLLGLCWGALVAWLNPNFLWWMIPILLSLVLAIPLSVLSSRVALGKAAYRNRLFQIPEETHPPVELVHTKTYTQQNNASLPSPGFADALHDPKVNALSAAMATGRHLATPLLAESRAARIARALERGPETLPEPEKIRLLDDPVVLREVHRQLVQARPTEGLAA
jgi:membrane glycosyltransferase